MSNKIKMSGEQYKALLAIQKGFCSKDKSRPLLMGLCFRSSAGRGSITALDGYKMHTVEPEYMQGLETLEHVLTLPALKVTKKQLVYITFEDNGAVISDGTIIMNVSYIDGQYISTSRLIPDDAPAYTITFGVKLLHEAITAYKSAGAEYVTFDFQDKNDKSVKTTIITDTEQVGILLPFRMHK